MHPSEAILKSNSTKAHEPPRFMRFGFWLVTLLLCAASCTPNPERNEGLAALALKLKPKPGADTLVVYLVGKDKTTLLHLLCDSTEVLELNPSQTLTPEAAKLLSIFPEDLASTQHTNALAIKLLKERLGRDSIRYTPEGKVIGMGLRLVYYRNGIMLVQAGTPPDAKSPLDLALDTVLVLDTALTTPAWVLRLPSMPVPSELQSALARLTEAGLFDEYWGQQNELAWPDVATVNRVAQGLTKLPERAEIKRQLIGPTRYQMAIRRRPDGLGLVGIGKTPCLKSHAADGNLTVTWPLSSIPDSLWPQPKPVLDWKWLGTTFQSAIEAYLAPDRSHVALLVQEGTGQFLDIYHTRTAKRIYRYSVLAEHGLAYCSW